MGRRALRKIDPELDLSRHLMTLEELPSPWDAGDWFGSSCPLEVEIGCGKGLFLRKAAVATPQHHFVGVELARKYARFAAAQLAKRRLNNALMINGDGLRLMSEFLRSDAAVAVHVYFPDPWWKKRHHKRRIMTDALVGDIERVLVPGGRLHFWTDVKAYFDDSLELIARSSELSEPQLVQPPDAQDDLDYRTHFERRTRLHQEAVYAAEFIKP